MRVSDSLLCVPTASPGTLSSSYLLEQAQFIGGVAGVALQLQQHQLTGLFLHVVPLAFALLAGAGPGRAVSPQQQPLWRWAGAGRRVNGAMRGREGGAMGVAVTRTQQTCNPSMRSLASFSRL